ncbi:cathepsin K-like [Aricia agestis]|uniref:cathepsin K-like n=1 Tax=Aricia agestis TaxID=91739 RepID=UPI001C203026|nr:cathepsin K-like [Aricia agestis]
MAVKFLVVLCFRLLSLSSAFVLENNISEDYDQQTSLRLPTEYHFKGDVISTDLGIIRPFEIWYSERHNRSRRDTYGGMVRRYYYGDCQAIYTIHPEATSELVSRTMCTANKNNEKPRNFLPPYSSDKFKHSGKTMYDDKLVDLWTYSAALEKDHQSVTQLLVMKENELQWEETELSLRNGMVVRHLITRYYDYNEPSLDDITLKHAQKHCAWDEASSPYNAHPGLPSDVAEAFQRLVTEHNSRKLSYRLGLNRFSDRLPSELAHLTATRPGSPAAAGTHTFPLTAQQLEEMVLRLPKNYDMRVEGLISTVKDQGDCGSCYAFATVAAVEGAFAKKNASWNLDLSEQSLVDCSWSEKNHGCNGGFLDAAFDHVQRHGVPTDMQYGIYLAEEGVCKYNSVTKVTRIKSFTRVLGGSLAMKAVLYNYGPVASSINAMDELKHYENGIYYNPDCNKNGTNHAVTVVGYGESDGTPYWIIKNSWGEDWGQAGYMFLSAENNNCHLLDEAYFAGL